MSRSWWSFALVLSLAGGAACSTAALKQAPPLGSSPDDPAAVDCFPEDEDCEVAADDLDGGTGGEGGSKRDTGSSSGGEPDGLQLPPMTSAVSVQVQPVDKGAAILSAIKSAKTSLHMTMYLLTDDEVIDALGDLKDQGRDVKVVLNKTFPQYGGNNSPAYNALKARGVNVVWAPSGYTYTHAKTIIIDGAKAIIMTMNLTQSSPETNREYIATDTDPQDVADAEKLFEADFENKAVTVTTSKLVVSPNQGVLPARDHLLALIQSATKSLDVEAQSLSDTAIVDAILAAHQKGVEVRVIIDGDTSDSSAQLKTIERLKAASVPLRSLKTPDLHAKVIVADEERAFIGSQNLTATGLVNNRELGVITNAKSEVTKIRSTISSDFTKGVQL